MSVPTKPQTLATWARLRAERGTRPGVETASHGSEADVTGSSGSSTAAPATVTLATRAKAASRTRIGRMPVPPEGWTSSAVGPAVRLRDRGRGSRTGRRQVDDSLVPTESGDTP